MVVMNTEDMNAEEIIVTNIYPREQFIYCIISSRKVA